MTIKHHELTEQIIGAFFDVYNSLGYGFLEKVYEQALLLELRERGLAAEGQKRIFVHYRGTMVGDYFADIVVDEKVVLELKTAESIARAHLAQLTNYLQATTYEVGLVLNFGPEPKFGRRYFSNDQKKHLLMNQRESARSASSVSHS